ncbi:MAG TPA: hypothetical protein VGK19_03765 [Capsulimonadaceae bacterium]
MSDLKTEQPKESPLLDTKLIPEKQFHDKLKAIFSVPKSELDERLRDHPEPPQKRGRKPNTAKL